ncbi:MAG: O-antigen ligase [Planctomycetota bacterium]|jgi:O-antigen ligase
MKAIIKSVYPYLFLFFCFVLPLDKYATAIPNILLVTLLCLFPFVVKKQDFKKILSIEVIVFASLTVYITVNSLFFQDYNSDFSIIKKVASSILLIVLFIPVKNIEKLKKAIIISVFTCIIICLVNLYWFYINEGEFNFASGGIIDEVLIIDRLYLGFLCVLSIIVSLGLIGNKYSKNNKWYFANIILNILFVLLISSRVAIILLIVLFFFKIFYSKRKKEYLFFLFGIIGIIVIAFSLNKNLQERFFYTQSTKANQSYIEHIKSWEPRFVIWNCNYSISQKGDFLLTGLGFNKTNELLVACYSDDIKKKNKRVYFIKRGFNTHNQFIDFLLSTGFLGFLLFSFLLILLFYKNKKSYFKTALFISIFAFAFIESFFHRQLGAYVFAIVMILILFPSKKEITAQN